MDLEVLEHVIDKKEVEELQHISRILSPEYNVIKKIGNGGMGNVYLAKVPHISSEPVALKILHPECSADENLLKRFLREAELLEKIDHPNIVKVYEGNCVGGLTFYVMEYAKGETLEKILKEKSFPVSKIPEFVIAVASALNEIHQKGIIHRDLKPANIILDEKYQPKLMDFGIARPENSQLTHHNEIVGSVCYIAPEIWIGEEPTPSVDLYSLGIVLYEIATGNVPFDGNSPGDLMRKHLQMAPVPPKDVQSGISSFINRLILRLLAKQKQERPRDALELIGIVQKNISVSTDLKKFRAYRQDTEEFLRVVNTNSEVALKKVEREKDTKSIEMPSQEARVVSNKYFSEAKEETNSNKNSLYISLLVLVAVLAVVSVQLFL